MTTEHLTAFERAAMIVFAGLLILAMPVIGVLNTIAGSMSGMIEYGEGDSAGYALAQSGVPEGVDVTAMPIIEPNLRATILAVALIVLALMVVYRFISISGGSTASAAPAGD